MRRSCGVHGEFLSEISKKFILSITGIVRILKPSAATVVENVGTEPRTLKYFGLLVRGANYLACISSLTNIQYKRVYKFKKPWNWPVLSPPKSWYSRPELAEISPVTSNTPHWREENYRGSALLPGYYRNKNTVSWEHWLKGPKWDSRVKKRKEKKHMGK